MAKLTTPVMPEALPPLDYADSIVALGSCFVLAMGSRLSRARFNILINPHGTLFNPISIAKTVRHALTNKLPAPSQFFRRGDRYAHTDYHSDLARESVDDTIHAISQANQTLRIQLSCARWLILTLGSAWVYRNANGEVATNCHKLPARLFTRSLLTVNEVAEELKELIDQARSLNPKLLVLLTVSPVRHLNDGLRDNATSKATLLLATHQLREAIPDLHYFPAYELLIDELRDYRYYADDLVHPSSLAEAVVWERLQQTWLSPSTRKLVARHEALARSIAHKPTSCNSPEYATFAKQMLREMEDLQRLTPNCNYDTERKALLATLAQ